MSTFLGFFEVKYRLEILPKFEYSSNGNETAVSSLSFTSTPFLIEGSNAFYFLAYVKHYRLLTYGDSITYMTKSIYLFIKHDFV